MPPSPLLPLALVDHRLQAGRRFGIRLTDLRRHVAIIGQTGMGKSALLEQLVLSLLELGEGVGLLDPHGDLAERILDRVPRSRLNDVLLLDPAARESLVGFNPLELHEAEPVLVASEVLAVFRRVFADGWGPRTEHLFRNALLLVLATRKVTLLSVSRVLVDPAYRTQLLARVTDPMVRQFWTREFAAWPQAFLAEVIAPLQNKLGAALSHPLLRGTFGQPHSTLIPRRVMDEGNVLLAKLSKGRMGEDASRLLGSFLVTSFALAGYARARVPVEARRPFVLAIDEAPSFSTSSFGSILEEARKYGLSLVLAFQHLGQLDDSLRRALFGNVGSLLVFRVGAEDAELLAQELGPEVRPSMLSSLSRYQLALKLSIDGVTSAPFTAVTLPPTNGQGTRALAERLSAERYGRARAVVDTMVEAQLGLARTPTPGRPTPSRLPL